MISSNSAIMSEDVGDITIPFGEEDKVIPERHPVAIFFHLLFRTLAILTYIFFGIFTTGFIVTFVTIIVLLSFDFWTTKNITGRLLVGLRWWNYVDEDGKSYWMFESRKSHNQQTIVNSYDSTAFWASMIVCQVLWIVFVLAAVLTFKLQWLLVACIGVCLNGANLYGYIRCKMGSQSKMKSEASRFLGQQIFSKFSSSGQASSSQDARS